MSRMKWTAEQQADHYAAVANSPGNRDALQIVEILTEALERLGDFTEIHGRHDDGSRCQCAMCLPDERGIEPGAQIAICMAQSLFPLRALRDVVDGETVAPDDDDDDDDDGDQDGPDETDADQPTVLTLVSR